MSSLPLYVLFPCVKGRYLYLIMCWRWDGGEKKQEGRLESKFSGLKACCDSQMHTYQPDHYKHCQIKGNDVGPYDFCDQTLRDTINFIGF